VLGDGSLREGKFIHDLAAEARPLLGEEAEDGDAGGVPERLRPRCEPSAMKAAVLGVATAIIVYLR
jgi:hypothetical protein